MSDDDGPRGRTVAIGQLAVAAAPATLRTLLGSCVAVILHARAEAIAGLAHVVLPDSGGRTDAPAKYADTAVDALLEDLGRLRSRRGRPELRATLIGGARMFHLERDADIGGRNAEALAASLDALRIPVRARDLGGRSGRHVTLDVASGVARVRIPGGESYDV